MQNNEVGSWLMLGIQPWTIDDGFLFNFVFVFYIIYFRFCYIQTNYSGDWHGNRSRRTEHDHLTYNLPILSTPMTPATIVMPMVHQIQKHYLNIIGAPCLVCIAYWSIGAGVISAPIYRHSGKLFISNLHCFSLYLHFTISPLIQNRNRL